MLLGSSSLPPSLLLHQPLRVGTHVAAHWLHRVAWLLGGMLLACWANAQPAERKEQPQASRAQAGPPERSIADWLVRLQQATRVPSYSGTYVVSSATGALSSARIEHSCEGGVQLERVEALTGEPRVTFRRNEAVMTYLPASRVVYSERRDLRGVFPNLLQPGLEASVVAFYEAKPAGQGRVAGADADVVVFQPIDKLRYGYRIWSERRTGMIVKMQTLDAGGQVLEQSAFSELTLNAPVQPRKLMQAMASDDGYRHEQSDRTLTSVSDEGWELSSPVPGFMPQACYRQRMQGQREPVVQWVFSDGLATVSLFMERLNAETHPREGSASMGATHTLTRRLTTGNDAWWLTAVGEVPTRTLQEFADRLRRTR